MATDAGFPFDRAAIDGKIGFLSTQLREVLDDIQKFKVRLIDDHTQAEVRAIYAAAPKVGEVQAGWEACADLARTAVTDLDTLARVSKALATVPSANDFFFNARKTSGVNG